MIRSLACLATVGMLLVLAASVHADLILQLKPADYNESTGTWHDTSGNNNDATQATADARPALVTGQTVNGSSVLRFDGWDYQALTSSITDNALTIFAYLRPVSGSLKAIVGGSSGDLEYRIYSTPTPLRQELVMQQVQKIATSFTDLSVTSFSSISLAIDKGENTYSFRLEGNSDGSGTSALIETIGGIHYVGAALSAVEYFKGDIAEIRIYNTAMSDTERSAVEAEFVASYQAIPEPASLSLLALGGLLLIRHRRKA